MGNRFGPAQTGVQSLDPGRAAVVGNEWSDRSAGGPRRTESLRHWLYVVSHRWLVRRTNAYRRLYHRLAALCGLPPGLVPVAEGLLVPSSTGDVLQVIGGAAQRWTCIDINGRCLDACRVAEPGSRVVSADLAGPWPLPGERFDLAVSVHALHWFDDPERLVATVASLLAPGGRAVWVVFAGHDGRTERVDQTFRRIAQECGWREAWNFLPWKVTDAIMRRYTARPMHFFDRAALTRICHRQGFTVETLEPAYNGCSWIAVAQRREEPCP